MSKKLLRTGWVCLLLLSLAGISLAGMGCEGGADDDASSPGDDDATAGDDDLTGDDDTGPSASPGGDDDTSGDDDATTPQDRDGDGQSTSRGDCNDADATVYAGATELCDNKDNNCNSQVDEGLIFRPYYQDSDGDGFGNESVMTSACTAPAGFVGEPAQSDRFDCDDSSSSTHPDATETCNTRDDDCDGQIDEGVLSTFYLDADGDGYGLSSVSSQDCSAPAGYVAGPGTSDRFDCDDTRSAVHPGALEGCDGLDNNCDGQVDEGLMMSWHPDEDSDGFGNGSVVTVECAAPSGYVIDGTDCDDSVTSIHPGAPESCNNLDEDCDHLIDDGLDTYPWHPDSDKDGFGSPDSMLSACGMPEGYVEDASDCNDTDAETYPGAPELCDKLDNSCDGQIDEGLGRTWYADRDQDGYGDPKISIFTCSIPPGNVLTPGDCDDHSPAVYPDALETLCNAIDENCNGGFDDHPDDDKDGYDRCDVGIDSADDKPADCDDGDASVHPGMAETGDGIDSNCDGKDDLILTGAGNGLGDGALATRAQLLQPRGVVFDGSGNLYVADSSSGRVRRISASSGRITTFAGGGFDDSSDYIPATERSFGEPLGLAIDAKGSIYLSDFLAGSVFRIDPYNQQVVRVAGLGYGLEYNGDNLPATLASLSFPAQIAVDGAGNLFIADSGHNRIRKVSAGTGMITTVAGTGLGADTGDEGPATRAALNHPTGVLVDGKGTLYIADSSNHVVRKVSGGIITRIAGTGSQGFSGDHGPATDAALNSPSALALSGDGTLYIADTGNNRIRKLSSSGVISTVAGAGGPAWYGDDGPALSAGLYAPGGLALGPDGNLYIGDTLNDRIRRVDLDSTYISTIAGGFVGDDGPASEAMLTGVQGMAMDAQGNLYLSDSGQYRIRKVSSSGLISTIAGTGAMGQVYEGQPATLSGLTDPAGIAVNALGDVFFADGHLVLKVRKSDGILQAVAGQGGYGSAGDDGAATQAQLTYVPGMAFDSIGNLYLADAYSYRVRRISARNGLIDAVAGNGLSGRSGDGGPATRASMNIPVSVAFDGADNLYVLDYGNGLVRKVDSSSGIITTVAGNGASSGISSGLPATSASLVEPFGLAVDGIGNLYIGEGPYNTVQRVSAASGVITSIVNSSYEPGFAGDGGAPADALLNGVGGLLLDPSGNLYLSDLRNHRIRKIVP